MRGAGKLLTNPNTSNVYQTAVKKLQDAGIRLTSGQKTGSQALRVSETTLSDTLVGGSVRKAQDRARMQLQRQLFRLAGMGE
jgi:hypothetical protein